MSSPSIRRGTSEDVDATLGLWGLAGAKPSVTDNAGALSSLLARDPEALLIADCEGELVGSLIAGWNGWRGSLYRLAVHPDHRRRGLATRLVREAEQLLARRGAARIDAIVVADEAAAMSFWSAAGYECQAQRSRFVLNL